MFDHCWFTLSFISQFSPPRRHDIKGELFCIPNNLCVRVFGGGWVVGGGNNLDRYLMFLFLKTVT